MRRIPPHIFLAKRLRYAVLRVEACSDEEFEIFSMFKRRCWSNRVRERQMYLLAIELSPEEAHEIVDILSCVSQNEFVKDLIEQLQLEFDLLPNGQTFLNTVEEALQICRDLQTGNLPSLVGNTAVNSPDNADRD